MNKSAPSPLHQTQKGVIIPEPQEHIRTDDKMSLYAGLYAHLTMKLSPKAAQSNTKYITSKIWYNHLNPLLLVESVNTTSQF